MIFPPSPSHFATAKGFRIPIYHGIEVRYLKFQVPKMEESEDLYKLYGYGLCKGKPIPKIAENKVQETLHFRYLKLVVNNGNTPWEAPQLLQSKLP